jgi:hypothetical protein
MQRRAGTRWSPQSNKSVKLTQLKCLMTRRRDKRFWALTKQTEKLNDYIGVTDNRSGLFEKVKHDTSDNRKCAGVGC